ncbi:MAG: hypothetical protein U0360_08300 [Dehalococcoidia bacterium]
MVCNQLVTIDNCCNPTECAKPASHQHAPSGLALCGVHYGNAVTYSSDGTWTVGSAIVSFPEGWSAVPSEAPSAASVLTPTEDVRPSGLVIETGTLSPSGLVIEK